MLIKDPTYGFVVKKMACSKLLFTQIVINKITQFKQTTQQVVDENQIWVGQINKKAEDQQLIHG